ncbi:MAG TPA: xanthine dehydrogenase family protein molybdopterin-binding subunit [Bryobacterales bacterium]|nr:xanthine dehydrogenase family protein molybdopterin-binding subunit [Bryobacterales bacterium]
MPSKYDWPPAEKRSLIGKRVNRLDGPHKSSGVARYAYDTNPPGLLTAKMLTSPYAHAKVTRIDTSEAERLPGVRAVEVIAPAGTELQWEGQEIAAVAADTEELARDGVRKIKVEYEVLPHLVHEYDLTKAGNRAKPSAEETKGNPDQAFSSADVVHEGEYGINTECHCCLEAHGQVVEWNGDNVTVTASTQAVGRLGGDLAKVLASSPGTENIKPSNIRVITQYMGGGFGSKFSIDTWGIACTKLARRTGKPVKLMLERDQELQMAGMRPSDFAKIKVGAKKDGTVVAWESESWSTGGMAGGGAPPLPYIFADIPNQKKRHIAVSTNTGPARAWRAPNHPQAAVLTMNALDDLAAKLNMDPVEVFMKNLHYTPRPDVYEAELKKAMELMDWKAKWHPRGQGGNGHIKSGVGVSIHTWGGRPHDSDCRATINPDGSCNVALGSQDLGVGCRTVIGIVAAETFGLPLSAVEVLIGDSNYPPSGASGGSTTTGGVSASTRRACIKALDKLFEAVAPSLGTTPDKLVARDGRILVEGDPSKSLTWKAACAKLGSKPISEIGRQPARGEGNLNDSNVGGVGMAEVEVDTETGIITMKKYVAVQDCGLVISLKTAESQVFGAAIMGICSALYEERIYDQQVGKMLNANMEFYKLSGIGDIGDIVVHMVQGPYDSRGVIGLGEPPAVSPPAAISNAVANAIGVRVQPLPMTPDKVLAALARGGRA